MAPQMPGVRSALLARRISADAQSRLPKLKRALDWGLVN